MDERGIWVRGAHLSKTAKGGGGWPSLGLCPAIRKLAAPAFATFEGWAFVLMVTGDCHCDELGFGK